MKNIYKITILVILVIVVGGLIYWFWPKTDSFYQAPSNVATNGSLQAPEFMSDSEKKVFGLPSETKVQVISREKDGEISVYKIIRSDSDVVSNPSLLPPISPRSQE